MEERVGWRRAVAVWVGLGSLIVMVVVVNASTTAPQQANPLYKRQLSGPAKFGAYPDLATGEGGLVVAVWTQGPGTHLARHFGPVKLGWISDSAAAWDTMTVDVGPANAVAVAVAGSTAHIAWVHHSDLPKDVYYTSCDLSQASPACASKELVAEGGAGGIVSQVSQVDLALDQSGTAHIIWAEGDNRGIYHSYKTVGQNWASKTFVDTSEGISDFPAIAVNHFDGEDYAHVVWAQQLGDISPYHVAKYNRWDGVQWMVDPSQLAGEQDYPARNLSIAADDYGNVYVVWDLLVDYDEYKREYVIGQAHSDDNGNRLSWPFLPRTYPGGDARGSSGAVIFKSGEEATSPEPETGEYAHFLRPHISLAASGTLTVPVPVLAWHAQVLLDKGDEPELAQLVAQPAHKVFWTYATKPGSDAFGDLFWASDGVITTTDYITLSLNFCGDLEMNTNSATPHLAIAGDLNNVKDGGVTGGEDHLHAVYHEEIDDGIWGVFYSSNVTVNCLRVYLPLVLQNYGGIEGK